MTSIDPCRGEPRETRQKAMTTINNLLDVKPPPTLWNMPPGLINSHVDYHPQPDPFDGALAQHLRARRARQKRIREVQKKTMLLNYTIDPRLSLPGPTLRAWLSKDEWAFVATEIAFDEICRACGNALGSIMRVLSPVAWWPWIVASDQQCQPT